MSFRGGEAYRSDKAFSLCGRARLYTLISPCSSVPLAPTHPALLELNHVMREVDLFFLLLLLLLLVLREMHKVCPIYGRSTWSSTCVLTVSC